MSSWSARRSNSLQVASSEPVAKALPLGKNWKERANQECAKAQKLSIGTPPAQEQAYGRQETRVSTGWALAEAGGPHNRDPGGRFRFVHFPKGTVRVPAVVTARGEGREGTPPNPPDISARLPSRPGPVGKGAPACRGCTLRAGESVCYLLPTQRRVQGPGEGAGHKDRGSTAAFPRGGLCELGHAFRDNGEQTLWDSTVDPAAFGNRSDS